MATCSNICRIVVIVINCLFMIVGLVLFAFGLFLRFGESVIEDATSTVEKAIESSLSSAGFSNTDINLDWAAMLLEVALVLTFAGLFFIVVTMAGCCGSCYKIKCLLVIYVVVCSILLVGQAVVIGLAYGSPKTVKDPLKDKLKDNIQSGYAGINGTNLVSVAWNIVMQQLDCCGVDSYADFTGATNWVIDYSGNSPSVTLKTPLACCKVLPTSADLTCAGLAASSSDNNLDKGCFNEVWDKTFGNTLMAAAILGVLGAFQLLLIILSIGILCAENNAKKNKIRPVEQGNTSRSKQQKTNPRVQRRNNPRLMQRK